MIKTKLETNEDILSFLNLLDCAVIAVESQYQAGQYSQKNYDHFYTLIHRLSRIQKSKGTHFVRYVSQKQKNTLEQCLQIGWEAAEEACKAGRMDPTLFKDIIRLYRCLEDKP